jgi:hypothetical protein
VRAAAGWIRAVAQTTVANTKAMMSIFMTRPSICAGVGNAGICSLALSESRSGKGEPYSHTGVSVDPYDTVRRPVRRADKGVDACFSNNRGNGGTHELGHWCVPQYDEL